MAQIKSDKVEILAQAVADLKAVYDYIAARKGSVLPKPISTVSTTSVLRSTDFRCEDKRATTCNRACAF